MLHVLAGPGKAYLSEPERLKYFLAPLICRNAAEQERFYEVFDTYIAKVMKPLEGEVTGDQRPVTGGRRKRLFLVTGIIAVLILAWTGFELYRYLISEPPLHLKVEYPRELTVGDTLRMRNTSENLDTARYRLYWSLLGMDSSRQQQLLATDSNRYEWTPPLDTLSPVPVLQVQLAAVHKLKGDTTRVVGEEILVLCPNPPREVTILAPGYADPGKAVWFKIGEEPEPGVRYRWIFEDTDTPEGKAVRHTFDEVGPRTVALYMDRPGVRGYCQTQLFHSIQIGQEQVILPPKPLIRADLEPHLTFAVGAWLLLGLLGLAVLLFWLKWANRQPVTGHRSPVTSHQSRFSAQDRAPYFIPFRDRSMLIRPSREPVRFADVLRQRQEGLKLEVDVPASVKATIDRGGFPVLKERYNTQPTDYLFLVDEQSPHSHQARLFQYLVGLLREQDVHMDVFFFKNEPGRVWNAEFPNGLTLDQLHRQYPIHRLVLMGEGQAMLDPGSIGGHSIRGSLLAPLRTWKQRILLTPVAPRNWGFQEAALQQLFVVFPADLDGLTQAAGYLEAGLDPSDLPLTFKAWKEQLEASRRDPDPQFRRWRTLKEHREYLHDRPDLFRWLCATVLYPKPTWEMTLAIGEALGLQYTYDDLLILSRISWLQTGDLHPRLREELLDYASADDQRLAREAVRRELAAVAELSSRGAANQELQIHLAIQDFALEPGNPEFREAIRQLLDAGLIHRRQEAELDQVVRKQAGSAEEIELMSKIKGMEMPRPGIREYLEKEQPVTSNRRPVWTLDFKLAIGLSALWILLFIALWTMIERNTLEKWFTPTDQQRNFFFVKETYYIDSAAIYNNWGVDTFYADPAKGLRAAVYFQKAEGLPVADTNLLKLYYNLGVQQLDSLLQSPITNHQSPITLFHQALPLPDALHGLGVAHFYLENADSARVYYDRLLAETDSLYFDTLSIFPNLETLLFPNRPPEIREVNVAEAGGGLEVYMTYFQNERLYPSLSLEAVPLQANGRIPRGCTPAVTVLRGGRGEALLLLDPPNDLTAPISTTQIRLRMRAAGGDVVEERLVPYAYTWEKPSEYSDFGSDYLAEILREISTDWGALKKKADLSYEKTATLIPEFGIRGRYAVARSVVNPTVMEKITGVRPFVGGPHRGDNIDWKNRSSAARYNPVFLTNLRTKLAGVLENRVLRASLQGFYNRELRQFLQLYYLSYPQFAGNQDVLNAYREKVRKGESASPASLPEHFRPFASEVSGIGYEFLEAYTASSFWVRRTADGTQDEFYDLLLLMLQTFDPEFLASPPKIGQQQMEQSSPDGGQDVQQNQPAPSGGKPLIPEVVSVKGGTFTMGCTKEQGNDCEEYEKPAHQVKLSDFKIGKYEVTQAEWVSVMGENPSRFSGCDQCPVEQVSWEDVQEYIRRLNALTGQNFRLPTEAEWEYAARGGSQSKGYKYSGNDNLDEVGWHNNNSGSKTHPVGQKKPNELGLYDMSGNLYEWCSDLFGDYTSESQTNPKGPGFDFNRLRVLRGGSWGGDDWVCRMSYRGRINAGGRNSSVGFRLAQD